MLRVEPLVAPRQRARTLPERTRVHGFAGGYYRLSLEVRARRITLEAFKHAFRLAPEALLDQTEALHIDTLAPFSQLSRAFPNLVSRLSAAFPQHSRTTGAYQAQKGASLPI